MTFLTLKFLAWNILRKFEQRPAYHCQYFEYLTLLSSFPDVKKSEQGASHEHKSRQLVGSTPSFP